MTASTALQRLDRLEGYLLQDPDNLSLLADTFDTALQAGDLARAESHLRHARQLAHAPFTKWAMREAHWLLAQHRWEEAERCLNALQPETELPSEARIAVLHDLAYIALRRGTPDRGLLRLRPLVDGIAADTPVDEAVQLLWLRLQHRALHLDDALAWATARWQAGQLAPAATGAASLLALDANDGTRALEWAEFALSKLPRQPEALVSRATIALAQNNAALSRQLLSFALQQNPQDGRSLSALGFTELLEHKLGDARRSFESAVASMPSHIGTWHGLAWTRLLQGDLSAAQEAFEIALQLDRNFGESHGGLAVVQAMQGLRQEAEASAERAMRLDRSSHSAHFAKAVLRGEAGDPRAINRLATRLLSQRPGVLGGTLLDDVRKALPGLGSSGEPEPPAS